MKPKIAIIVGSTRPGRLGPQVADWVLQHATQRSDAEFELVDVMDLSLPLLDEAVPPSMGQYENEHTKNWAAKAAAFDGFIFVTAEYNHSIPAALKNAIDYLYAEWNNKVAGFVSYGSAGGVRAVEQLRQVMAELQIADVRVAPFLSLGEDFEKYSVFKPREHQHKSLDKMLDQLLAWAPALKTVRQNSV